MRRVAASILCYAYYDCRQRVFCLVILGCYILFLKGNFNQCLFLLPSSF